MFTSKVLMEFLPNVHLLGVFIVAITIVYRQKALYPIYIYVFLNGVYAGFSTWWLPYLYIWTVLWGVTMLLPRKLPMQWQVPLYTIVCGLHGFLFGTLYAPSQALLFGLDFRGMLAWIIAGIPADIIHGVSNLICGLLICPMITVLKNSNKYVHLQ